MERIYQLFNFDLGSIKPLLFTELDFWLFFIAVMFIFSAIHKQLIVRSMFITAVSIFFYYKASGLFMLLLVGSMFGNYYIGNWIGRAEKASVKKRAMIIGVALNIFFLSYFKYGFFFTESYNELFHTDFKIFNQFAVWGNGFFGEGTFDVKLFFPIGVSFITFQSISYLIDVYRKEVEPVKNVFHYTFYATFFPQILMGPIARAKDFIPQIYAPYELNKEDFSWAAIQIVKGLAKKLILADFVYFHFIKTILADPAAFPGFVGVVTMWAYSLYIYGDFSGYTDMARGIARLMGFKLFKNFDSPYKALNVGEFWRRWHRSLGAWFRDYLYIPLGGNKGGGVGSYILIFVIMIFLIFITQWYELLYIYAGVTVLYLILVWLIPNFKKYVHRDLNLLITMVIGGLWHNPSQNFVIWGTMNGVALVIYNYWKTISPYEHSTKWPVRAWKIFLTFNFITFTRIWFKLEGDDDPGKFLDHIWNHFELTAENFNTMITSFMPVMITLVIGMIVHWLPQAWKDKGESYFTKMHVAAQLVAVCILVVLIYQVTTGVSGSFVYFKH